MIFMTKNKTKSKKTKIKEEKVSEKKNTENKSIKEKTAEKKASNETTKKTEDQTPKKEVKKKKFIPKVKKSNKTKSSEAKKVQETLKEVKKKLPTFRGRFGKKNIRRKSKAKWDKWRKPRGIDLDRGLEHGYTPKIGYKTKSEIRGIHPSGYSEVRVENIKQLENINSKKEAVKIGSTVGKRKRNEIIKKANEKGIWILN